MIISFQIFRSLLTVEEIPEKSDILMIPIVIMLIQTYL